MLKITHSKINSPRDTVKMRDMKPLQVGVIDKEGHPSHNIIVFCTSGGQEVLNLSNPRKGGCWTYGSLLPVRLLSDGESVTITLANY